jgi:hypothetical protein
MHTHVGMQLVNKGYAKYHGLSKKEHFLNIGYQSTKKLKIADLGIS